jgi:hypothetical protein
MKWIPQSQLLHHANRPVALGCSLNQLECIANGLFAIEVAPLHADLIPIFELAQPGNLLGDVDRVSRIPAQAGERQRTSHPMFFFKSKRADPTIFLSDDHPSISQIAFTISITPQFLRF